MAPTKIFVVIGATGKQGGGVVNALVDDPETKALFTIRGVTRDKNSDKAKALAAKGVEVVEGDITDKASLNAAFKGAHTVFSNTDFWSILDKEKEIQQGKNIADAAKEEGVQHLIASTLWNVTKATNGKLDKVLHFDSKAAIEDYIRSLDIPASFFMPGFYMSNIPGQFFPDKETGKYALNYPTDRDSKVPLFDAEADSGKFVKAIALHRDELLGKRIYAASEYLTFPELVATFEKVKPKDGAGAQYRNIPRDGFKGFLLNKFPEMAAEDLTQMFEFFSMVGYYNNEPLDDSLKILKEKPTSWADFVAKEPAWKSLS